MKSIIKCNTTKEIWNGLILTHEAPFDIKDTKIAAMLLQHLRVKSPGNHQKDYNGKYKGLKAEMAILSQRIDDLTQGKNEKGRSEKGKSKKGLIAESFDWNDESVSSDDEGTTKIKAFMAIAEDEPSVRKADEITMKKEHIDFCL
ncbi:hypothetical protein Tco_1224140 [Tanacetum coccineum]